MINLLNVQLISFQMPGINGNMPYLTSTQYYILFCFLLLLLFFKLILHLCIYYVCIVTNKSSRAGYFI